MIIVKDSNVCVQGTKVELLAELATVISGLVDNGFDWEDIDTVFKVVKMSPDELQAETDKIRKELENNPFGMWLLHHIISGDLD